MSAATDKNSRIEELLTELIAKVESGGGTGAVVDADLSISSTNSVQNRVIANALNEKADLELLGGLSLHTPITQAEYDALTNKDPTVLYPIVG